MLIRILLSLSDATEQQRLHQLLKRRDVLVTPIAIRRLSSSRLRRETPDIIIVSHDVFDNPDISIEQLRDSPENPEVAVVCNEEDPNERVRLMADGACAVLNSAVTDDEMRDVLNQIMKRRSETILMRIDVEHKERSFCLDDFVSASPAMQTFMKTVHRVVAADNSLLILGETGVGKEHMARAIHEESPRANGAFISVNCAALPETLLESELFGHEEGAFTGANRPLRGQFELAHGGTIFLDEIGEMPLHLQAKLLHVLDRRQFRRVGGERIISVNVRVIAATNRNLPIEVDNQRFRQDLYYRLGALTLIIPPLRERSEDIPELVHNYLQYLSATTGRVVGDITPAAMTALTFYNWPGNVRELINVIERAILLCTSQTVDLDDLPPTIASIVEKPTTEIGTSNVESQQTESPTEWSQMPLRQARQHVVERFERTYLTRLLTETKGRIGTAARKAEISSRALYTKMQQLGLRKEDFRE